MKDLRMWLGKNGTVYTSTLLERCAMTLVNRKATRASGRRANKGGANETSSKKDDDVEIDVIFCEAFVHAIDSNYFGKGPPKHNKPGPSCKRNNSNSEDFIPGEEGYSTVGDAKKLLNKDVLKIFNIGEDRAQKYFNRFARNPDFYSCSKRSEKEDDENKGVSLKTVEPLKAGAENDMRIKIKRSTSVQYEVLNKHSVYTVPDLKVDLQELLNEYKRRFDVDEGVFGPCSSDSKSALINKLIMLRQMMIAKDSDWKERRETEVRRLLERDFDRTDINRIIENELRDPFYSLQHGSDTVNIDHVYSFTRPGQNGEDNADEESNEIDSMSLESGNDQDSIPGSQVITISDQMCVAQFKDNWFENML